jgi:hypothetical protein
MQEHFLHYIWEHQYFDKSDLRTSQGEPVSILRPGMPNTHAGPDFSQARVRIGALEWNGPVELHVRSSDWDHHGHTTDPAYGNVILHVVWHHDAPGRELPEMPVLELRHRIDPALFSHYQHLVNGQGAIPCEGQLPQVPEIIRLSMVESALMERMEQKAEGIRQLLHANTGDWEEATWQALCRNFGFKVNAEPFLELSRVLPYKILIKHSHRLDQAEALLFGQAGFLEEPTSDAYLSALSTEYTFLSHKYQIHPQRMMAFQWKFLRLRPPNFPTVRLAQLAKFIHQHPKLFSLLMHTPSSEELLKKMRVNQSDYWKKHYRPEVQALGLVPGLGQAAAENILINTLVPLRIAYARETDQPELVENAVGLLHGMRPESNRIIAMWQNQGISAAHAFDSQGLIELYNNYCKKRRCLQCRMGAHLIQPPMV